MVVVVVSVMNGGDGGSYCDDYGEGNGGGCDSSTGDSDSDAIRTVLSYSAEEHCKYSVTFTNL
jgi:hypothetical protein